MKSKRIISLLLSWVLLLSMLPGSVAAESAAADAVVTLTVSNQGVLASDRDSKAMANRSVTVKDLDADGILTYHEALVAAHAAYNTADGYDTNNAYGYVSVSKLWGINTSNSLFFNNNAGLATGVDTDTVKTGDHLVASINQDNTRYADWYTFFDSNAKEATVGESFTLTLKGHLGMAGTDSLKTDVATAGVSVGTWNNGTFSALSDKTTDESGKVTLSFDTAGTYYVTASGTVSGQVPDYTQAPDEYWNYPLITVDCPIIAPVCVVTVTDAPVSPDAMSDADAIDTVYEEFSKYSTTKTALTFPLTYNEKQYTNITEYIKAWAKDKTGREISMDATVSPYTSTYTDWSSGTAQIKSYTPLAENGTVTQGYFSNNANNTMNHLKNVTFTVGTKTSEKISQIRLSIPSLQRSEADIVAYAKASLPFVRIANENADANHIIQALGEKSGSTVTLPTAYGLYTTTSVKTAWSLNNISGKTDALSLSSNKITVSRPNVGDDNAVFDLTATITSKNDATATDSATYRLTVPAFDGVTVPIQITEGATLSLTDPYYGTKVAVADKYIRKQENAPAGYDLYHCTLHTSATGAAQKFNYTVTKDGYITQSGTIGVTREGAETKVISLVASSENDTKLASLQSTAPIFTVALDPNKTDYTIDVNGIQYITLAATPMVAEASVKLTSYYSSLKNANANTLKTSGTTLSSGTKCYLPDANGTSQIQITVTAPAGSTQTPKSRVYTLTVNKQSASSPLTGLTLTVFSSGKGTNNSITYPSLPAEEKLSPAFVPGGNESPYTYTVNYWRDQLTVKPTAASCTITVNGTTVASNTATGKIPLAVGNNEIKIAVTKENITTNYTINVYRKAEFYITDVTLDEGQAALLPSTDGSTWTGNCSFNHSADKIHVTYHTNLSPEDEEKVTVDVVSSGTTYSGKAGQPIEIPVGTAQKISPTTYLYYTAPSGIVEGQKYVISYSRKGADTPSAVESYLPAPGQFVNTTAWREVNKTLTGDSGITLGSFGGNVIYKYDEPIQNDPYNPYGIDFLIFGNCFLNDDGSTASGASEPAAVMVSKDGETWYELAGSEYYTATTRRNVTIAWQNGDATFSAATDTPWQTDDGESGILPTNEYHSQPYYPNPAYYNTYQNGIGKNHAYTKDAVSFTGTMIEPGFYPFGYADSHSAKNNTITNIAENPYSGNDTYIYNGDGFDLDWAVDEEGNPVLLDEISYIKIYNPLLSYGTSRGEISPEIMQVLRAASGKTAVGKSQGLTSLSINGKIVTPGTNNTYTFDAENASALKIKPTAKNANANIYVSNQYVHSEEEAVLTATEQVRIIVQEDNCEPVIYMLQVNNIANPASNADLASLTVTPGDMTKMPNEENQLNFTVANSVSAVRLTPQASNKKATMSLSGGTLTEPLTLTHAEQSQSIKLNVGENQFTLKVTSANGQNEKTYIILVTRESGNSGSGSSTPSNTIQVKFSLTGDTVHYDKKTETYTGKHTKPTWIATKTMIIPKGSTVKYLTELMLNNAGINYTTDGIYVSEINGLSELDNGPNSGWLYRYNGLIADVSYADRELENGDIIKWFYSDDYTKESGYEGNWDNVNASSGGSASVCTIRFETNGGTSISSLSVKKNSTLSGLEIPEKAGYTFAGWYTDKNCTNAYDFSAKVTRSFTLYAKWAEGETILQPDTDAPTFTDVLPGAWYSKAVTYAILHNLFRGISETEFAPDEAMTRAMLVTVLYRLEQTITPQNTSRFADVEPDAWYADAVAWAAENEIVSGINATQFAPHDHLTREQLAAILYRYAKHKGYAVDVSSALSAFTDAEQISPWAVDAMHWANAQELIHGVTDTVLSPAAAATRAQVALILMRFCETTAK